MALKEVRGSGAGHSLRIQDPGPRGRWEGSGSLREDEIARGSRQKEGRVRSCPVFEL